MDSGGSGHDAGGRGSPQSHVEGGRRLSGLWEATRRGEVSALPEVPCTGGCTLTAVSLEEVWQGGVRTQE